MDNIDLKSFIKDKLDLLDSSNSTYNNFINDKDIIVDEESSIITFKNIENKNTFKFSKLGVFDMNTSLWLWTWAIPGYNIREIKDAKLILDYGLTLEPQSNSMIHFYIKPHLINSRLYFESNIFLDIHLGLCLYISKAKFIYPRKREKINGKYLIVYYLIY